MKMKAIRTAVIILTITLLIASVAAMGIFAEESTPSVSIEKFTLSLKDNVYIKYAVKLEGADSAIASGDFGMLFWTSPQTTYDKTTAELDCATVGYEDFDDIGRTYVFQYTQLSAKQMTDSVYARAYAEVDGVVYYSDVEEYSILKYAYNKLGKSIDGKPTTNESLKTLLLELLEYGAAAQNNFGYKTDRLATANFVDVKVVGGVIAETGFSNGFYIENDQIILLAPAKDESGEAFVSWLDSDGAEIGYTNEYPLLVGSANETYTAYYHTHRFGAWTETVPPTCEGVGEEMRECSCGDVETRPVAAAGHTEVTDKAVSPTCTETGLTEGKHCSVCDAIITAQQEVEALGHLYGNDGVCTRCGHNALDQSVTIEDMELVSGASYTYTLDLSNVDKSEYVILRFNAHQRERVQGALYDNAILSLNGVRTLRVTTGHAMHVWNEAENTLVAGSDQWSADTSPQNVMVIINLRNDTARFVYNGRDVVLGSIDFSGDILSIKFGGSNTPTLTLKNISLEYRILPETSVDKLYSNDFSSSSKVSDGVAGNTVSYNSSMGVTSGCLALAQGWTSNSTWAKTVSLNGSSGDITITLYIRPNCQSGTQPIVNINGVTVLWNAGSQQIKFGNESTTYNTCTNQWVTFTAVIDPDTGDAEITYNQASAGYTTRTATVNVGTIGASLEIKLGNAGNSWYADDLTVIQDNPHVHSFSAWKEISAPTCSTSGEKSRTCSTCGKVETKEVDALGHNISNGVCTRCGERYTNYIYVDGAKVNAVPAKGNYVVYIDSGKDNISWDYTSWAPSGYSDDMTIYFFSVERLFTSVNNMVNNYSSLSVGDIVGTTSYYAGYGRGAAIYEIRSSSAANAIYISSGKYAHLVPFTAGNEKVVSVDQFGAYANGTSSDVNAIESAISFSGATTVIFEGDAYLQTSTINVTDVSNKTVNGRGAYIYNRYSSMYWTDFDIKNCSYITIENLELRCTETVGQGILYRTNDHVQLYVGASSNIVIDNVTLTVPNNTTNDRHVTAIWLQDGNDGVTVKNSTIKNFSNSSVGGGIWISSSDNVNILDNYIEKTSIDEALAFFNGSCNNALVEGNTIYTHDEPTDEAGRGSAHAVGFGVYGDGDYIYTNIIFRNNTLDVVSWKDAIMFGEVNGIEIYGNTITLRQNTSSQPVENAVFRVPAPAETTQSNVKIYNNTIKVENSYKIPFAESCVNGFTIYNNTLIGQIQ